MFTGVVWAQEPPESGSNGTRLAFPGFWNIRHNPAGLAHLNRPGLGLFVERLLPDAELAEWQLAGLAHYRGFSFGAYWERFGYSQFNRQRLGLVGSRMLSDRFSIGAEFAYLRVRIPEYGSAGSPLIGASLMYRTGQELSVGFRVRQMFREPSADASGRNPPEISLGLSYAIFSGAFVFVESTFDGRVTPEARGGIEFIWHTHFMGSLSWKSATQGLAAEVTVWQRRWRVTVGSEYHGLLGMRPSVGVVSFP